MIGRNKSYILHEYLQGLNASLMTGSDHFLICLSLQRMLMYGWVRYLEVTGSSCDSEGLVIPLFPCAECQQRWKSIGRMGRAGDEDV